MIRVRTQHQRRLIVRVLFVTTSMCAVYGAAEPAIGHGVLIAQNSSGQLVVHVDAVQPIQLPPSVFPGIEGHAAAEPGLASQEVNEPDEDLFLLNPACNIQFQFVSADPGLQIVTDHVWTPGETVQFGAPFFDFHFVFNIPEGQAHSHYHATLRFIDLSGIHPGNPEIELSFEPAGTICDCRGDTDGDEDVTGSDVQTFVDCVMETPIGGHPDTTCGCADLDGDGHLDELDIAMFVDHLLDYHGCH